MTRIGRVKVKCAKCGAESEQRIFHSINYSATPREWIEPLLNEPQKCPHCGYESDDISTLEQDEDGEN